MYEKDVLSGLWANQGNRLNYVTAAANQYLSESHVTD